MQKLTVFPALKRIIFLEKKLNFQRLENAGITQRITENMTETFKPTKKRTHFIRNSYLPMAACSAANSEQMF